MMEKQFKMSTSSQIYTYIVTLKTGVHQASEWEYRSFHTTKIIVP